MSKKAEERALEAYPVEIHPLNYQDLINQFGGKTEVDINTYQRYIFQEGYEQAEKDITDEAKYSSGWDGFFYGKGYAQAEKDLGWRSAKDSKPVPSEWVVVCVEDHGVPQCLALATYNEELDKWFTGFEDGEPEEYFPDYWLRLPGLKELK